ncbi:MAG: hypothetical protein PVH18_07610 [Chloroflexota bacterium]
MFSSVLPGDEVGSGFANVPYAFKGPVLQGDFPEAPPGGLTVAGLTVAGRKTVGAQGIVAMADGPGTVTTAVLAPRGAAADRMFHLSPAFLALQRPDRDPTDDG